MNIENEVVNIHGFEDPPPCDLWDNSDGPSREGALHIKN